MPEGDNFNLKSDTTFNVEIQTILVEDTAITHLSHVDRDRIFQVDGSSQLLGNYSDVLFGDKTSDMLYQVFPYDTARVPVGATIDSLILTIQKDSVLFGNRDEAQGYRIYELSKNIDAKKKFTTYVDYSPDYRGTLVSEGTFIPNTKLIRLPISDPDNLIGEKLSSIGGAISISDVAFSQVFRGFYISTYKKTGNGVLLNINLYKGSSSKLALYYSKTIANSKGILDSVIYGKRYYYSMDRTVNTSSIYSQNGASSLINNFSGNMLDTANYFYAQGVMGPYTKIKLPQLFNQDSILNKWKVSGNLAINKAIIEFYPDLNYLNGYGITKKDFPERLDLYYKDSVILKNIVYGYGFDSTNVEKKIINSSYDNSYRNFDKVNVKYEFNFTSLLQKIVKEKDPVKQAKWNNLELYLKDPYGFYSGGRVAFNKKKSIKIKVVYSIIK
jgi:hypothetical protein